MTNRIVELSKNEINDISAGMAFPWLPAIFTGTYFAVNNFYQAWKNDSCKGKNSLTCYGREVGEGFLIFGLGLQTTIYLAGKLARQPHIRQE